MITREENKNNKKNKIKNLVGCVDKRNGEQGIDCSTKKVLFLLVGLEVF